MVIRNFLFHRVSSEVDSQWPPMDPQLFSGIIRHLNNQFLVVPLEKFLDDPGAFSFKKKQIATVLFDDGYKDNIEYAVPILKKYKCPASFYIVTDSIDKNLPTWTYLADNVLQKTKKSHIELTYDFVPANLKHLPVQNESRSNISARELKPWMKRLSNYRRLLVLDSILSQCSDVELPAKKMMNWNDVRQLHNDGFIIGSHSHTHPMLSSIEDAGEINDELATSAARILAETGFFPETISYPIGSFDQRVIALSKQNGYKYGLAVKQQFFHYGKDDLFQIPRVELYQEPWLKVRLRISGVYAKVKKIWGKGN